MQSPHGEFKSGVNEQLLQFSARGPWNDVTMKTGVRKMAEHISTFSVDKPWAQLSCLYGESLMPPSTFDIFVKQTRVRKQRGLAFLAIVILDTDIKLTIRHQMSQCYEAAEVPFAFYDSVEAALDALSDKDITFDREEAITFFKRYDFSNR
ncbi:hypothetical protein D210916BOD24_05010 [Alteromonas sp. D210916BOD_24]|uniref:hypothetical protein n=1 Tax=Alteromonas sp. D210916BOD_24 TaxID=3157618 RepID=UPI00399D43F3